ncbi:MAG: hypothetical protein ACXQTL_06500 [Methanosarcinales archaeon]
MTRTLITRYKGYEIYFDDDRESTVPSPRWLISTGYSTLVFDGSLTLEEVKRWLDGY